MNQQVHLVLILAVLGSSLGQDSNTPPESPCPAVYRYGWSPVEGWHGVITIVPPLSFSEVQLVARLTLPYYRPDVGVGKIGIKGGDTEVQNIANRASQSQPQKIQFNVVFPAYKEFPRISSVKINGREFCPSPAYTDVGGLIELKYTLKTGLAVAVVSGNEFSVDGGSVPQPTPPVQTYQPQQPQWPQQQPQQPQRPPQQPQLRPPPPTQETSVDQRPGYNVYRPPPAQPRPPPVAPSAATPDPNDLYYELIGGYSQTSSQPLPNIIPQTPRPRPKPKPKPVTTTVTADYDYLDDLDVDITAQFELNSAGCGQPAVLPVNTLVLGGEDTQRGQWPWMASLFTATDKAFRCAGSLISMRHVITAAHCVADRTSKKPMPTSSIIVHLGRFNIQLPYESTQQVMEIEKIYVHPKFNRLNDKQDFDVGVIIFKKAARITEFVRTVCFWGNDKATSLDSLIGEIGMAPGWGKDENGQKGKELRLARMPVVSQETCLRSDTDFYGSVTSEKTFCAGFKNGTSLCNGDSGGGLYFNQDNPKERKNTWYIRGIVSISKLNALAVCGDKNYVVFTDIAKLLPWLVPRLKPPNCDQNGCIFTNISG